MTTDLLIAAKALLDAGHHAELEFSIAIGYVRDAGDALLAQEHSRVLRKLNNSLTGLRAAVAAHESNRGLSVTERDTWLRRIAALESELEHLHIAIRLVLSWKLAKDVREVLEKALAPVASRDERQGGTKP